ncbi:MAG: alkaline phosphatase [Candidatus Rifleibacteriota bacterium]
MHFCHKLLIALLILVCSAVFAQQNVTVPTPGQTDLITPLNIKPLSLEEFARRRGLTGENPARNIVILFGFGLADDAANLFRETRPKRLQVSEMENFEMVLPRFIASETLQQVNLVDFLTGDGRSVGIVSDQDFCCSAACEILKIEAGELFARARMALTLGDFSGSEERDALVRKFSGRNLEYAANRKDLDRMFSAKAEKIVGAFRRNVRHLPEDGTQPFVDELVTAGLSRLSVEENGFVLLVGCKAAEKAAVEGRFVDMLEHLRTQEKVLHQINYFVSGRKDTLVLLIQDSNRIRLNFGERFNLNKFLFDAGSAVELTQSLVANQVDSSTLLASFSFSASVDVSALKESADKKDAAMVFEILQKSIREFYQIETIVDKNGHMFPGFFAFSRGHGSDIFGGMVDFSEFINRLALVTGLKLKP